MKSIIAILPLLCLSFPALAGTVSYSSAGSFDGNDTLLWAQGGTYTTGSELLSGTTLESEQGIPVTTDNYNPLTLEAEGTETFVYSGSSVSAVVLTFGQAVQGVGFQIDQYDAGSFGGGLTAYDCGGVSNPNLSDCTDLGATNFSSTSPGHGDSTFTDVAPFVGISSDSTNIDTIVIALGGPGGPDGNAMEIGNLSLMDSPAPEPSSVVMLFGGLAAVASRGRFRA